MLTEQDYVSMNFGLYLFRVMYSGPVQHLSSTTKDSHCLNRLSGNWFILVLKNRGPQREPGSTARTVRTNQVWTNR